MLKAPVLVRSLLRLTRYIDGILKLHKKIMGYMAKNDLVQNEDGEMIEKDSMMDTEDCTPANPPASGGDGGSGSSGGNVSKDPPKNISRRDVDAGPHHVDTALMAQATADGNTLRSGAAETCTSSREDRITGAYSEHANLPVVPQPGSQTPPHTEAVCTTTASAVVDAPPPLTDGGNEKIDCEPMEVASVAGPAPTLPTLQPQVGHFSRKRKSSGSVGSNHILSASIGYKKNIKTLTLVRWFCTKCRLHMFVTLPAVHP